MIGQKLQLEIESLTNQGAGLARQEGLVIFVPGALPGEVVRAKILRKKKNYAEAQLLEVVTAAPERCRPACPVYAACGGCQLQHLSDTEQATWKWRWAREALQRLGGVELEVQAPPQAKAHHYRNRVQLHARWQKGVLQLGFYSQASRNLVPADDCLLMRPLLRELLALLQAELPRQATALQDLRHVVLRCDSAEKQALVSLIGPTVTPELQAWARELLTIEPRLASLWCNHGAEVYGVYGTQWQHLAGEERLVEQLGPVRLAVSAAAFTQVNPEQALLVYQQVAEYLQLAGGERLLDVYSGIGSIALYLAGQAGEVVGVEEYAPAVVDAQENAALNGAVNCRFVAGAAEQILPELAAAGEHFDCLVLDPPRAGCAASVLEAVSQLAIPRLVYVSCDVATLARDLRMLQGLGYRASRARVFDMFPQTVHLETVVLLER